MLRDSSTFPSQKTDSCWDVWDEEMFRKRAMHWLLVAPELPLNSSDWKMLRIQAFSFKNKTKPYPTSSGYLWNVGSGTAKNQNIYPKIEAEDKYYSLKSNHCYSCTVIQSRVTLFYTHWLQGTSEATPLLGIAMLDTYYTNCSIKSDAKSLKFILSSIYLCKIKFSYL